MLKNKSKLIVLLICIIMLISSISLATESTTPGENARTAEGDAQTTPETPTTEAEPTEAEIYNGDLYLFDNNIVMDKLVDGNVFIFGQNVEITGRVNGSLFVCANKVTFGENSYVFQSIFACANELILNGAANDLYAAANKIDMSYNSFMIRDLKVVADTFNFKGGVGRDAFVDANNFAFETTSGSSAIVYGNLTYSSNNELELSKELVQGEIKYSNLKPDTDTKSIGKIILDKVINFLETLLFTIVVFFLIAWFAPNFIEKSSEYISKKSFKVFGIGLLATIVSIFLALGLLFSYIAVPLAFATFGLFALMISISSAITITCITFKAKEKLKFNKKYLTIITLAVVTLILWALKQIPYVSGIISIIVTLLGFGILLDYIFIKNKKDKAVEVNE